MKVRLLAVLAVLTLGASEVLALGKLDLDFEMDAYYTALGLTVPFSTREVKEVGEKAEVHTYWDMFTQGLIPRFMVVEASVNPLPVSGWLVRKHAEGFYHSTIATPNLNLVEALTAGFEEPYALAVFLGEVVDFSKGKDGLGRSRKGYVGYLASMGNFHLLHNQMIPDNWLEVEAKIKGDQKTENRKMSWSFRGGRKFHGNGEILDSYYLGIRRSRIDYKKTRYSFFTSTSIEYRLDIGHDKFKSLSHFLLVEKNFPIPDRKMAFSLGVGYLWRNPVKYSGSLAAKRRETNSQIMIRPNLRF